MKKTLLALAALLVLGTPAMAQDATGQAEGLYNVKLGIGAFDLIDDEEPSVNLRAELHTNDLWWKLHPFAAVDVNTDGGVWGGAGLAADFELTPKIFVQPSVAAGLYADGNSKDLGGAFEMRSGIEAGYIMQNRHRIGLELTHISNAGIYDKNPGSETVSVNYHMPVSF